MNELKKTVGNKIKKYRLDFGYTQEDLAKKVNITKPAISQYESFKRLPEMKILRKLCNVFGITMSEMIGEIEKNNSKEEIMFKKYSSLTEKDQKSIENFIDFLIHIIKD